MKNYKAIQQQIILFFDLNRDLLGDAIYFGAIGSMDVGEYEAAIETFLLEVVRDNRTKELRFNKNITPDNLLDIANQLDTKDEWCDVALAGFWSKFRCSFKVLIQKRRGK